MRRKSIAAVAFGVLLLTGSRAICRDQVKRPMVRFMDFYLAAQEAEKPPSFLERIAYGIAVAFEKPEQKEATGDPGS